MFLLIEFVVQILVLVIGITQVVIPLIKGTTVFPIFRKERNKLEDELTTAKEEADLADLKNNIQKEHERAIKTRIRKV